jgi:predicted PurR-regulated permease PerM
MTPDPAPRLVPSADAKPITQREVTRTMLAVLSIGGLIAASFWILRPFLIALIWATMVVVATWPLLLLLQRWMRRRALAIVVMTIVMLLVFVLPFWIALGTLAEYSGQVGIWTKSLHTATIPLPPAFVDGIPLVGSRISAAWRDTASAGWEPLVAKAQPYVVQALRWPAGEAGNIGVLIVQFILTVIIAAVMYAKGEVVFAGVRRFGRRLAGRRGEQAIELASQAIRGIALGVVVTALVQSLLGGFGLLVAGIPFTGVLTVVMLMLCLAQIGVLPVLVPAVVWLFWTGNTVVASLFLVWTILVGTLDNVLRPFLIKKGADLPLLLIFAGVIGGLLAFGLLGIFVGPVVLAVTFKLLQAWVNEADAPPLVPDARAHREPETEPAAEVEI